MNVCIANCMFRSGADVSPAQPSSAQPSKRLQQTQAQVDEVHMLDIILIVLSFDVSILVPFY